MRLLAQFVGVLPLVGFVGAYFWWIVAIYRRRGNRVPGEPSPRRGAYRPTDVGVHPLADGPLSGLPGALLDHPAHHHDPRAAGKPEVCAG